MTRSRERRIRLYLLAELLLMLVASGSALLAPAPAARTAAPMRLGLTFSEQQASYLNINYQTTY